MGKKIGLRNVFGEEVLTDLSRDVSCLIREAYDQRVRMKPGLRGSECAVIIPRGTFSPLALNMLLDRRLLQYAPCQDFDGGIGTRFLVTEELMKLWEMINE